jgi:hypothetical protein
MGPPGVRRCSIAATMTTPERRTTIPGSGLRPIEARDLDGLEPYDYRDEDGYRVEYELSLTGRIRRWSGRLIVRVSWLLLAAGLAFGSAGAASALQQPPNGANRPELTWGADQALSARLDAATRNLVLLNDDVDQLGTMTRQTLSSLAQVNQVSLTQAWNGGANALKSIQSRSADLASSLECDPWDQARQTELGKLYSPGVIDRYHGVCQAIASIAPLKADWDALVAGSETAMQVATDINNHDQVAADALQLATAGRYPEALSQLANASAAISDATSIATELAKVTDVSTLQNWLTRTTGMDDALKTLWQAMIDSNGRINVQVAAALKGVNDAKALLPDDNSVLQVVLYELASRLTTYGISIETARGELSSALSTLVVTVQGQ